MNPLYLIIMFFPEEEPVARIYYRATEAVDNMGKAMEYYSARNTNCVLSLYDYRGTLIISQTVGTMPNENEEGLSNESPSVSCEVIKP